MFRKNFHTISQGQTLVGILMALSLSSTLLLIASQFFTQQFINKQQRLADLFLQQSTEEALQIIVKDLRRTGFIAVNKHLQTSNLNYFKNSQGKAWSIGEKQGETAQSCFLFFYDLNHSGCLGGKNNRGQKDDKVTHCAMNDTNQMMNVEKELFGYRLNQGRLEQRSEQQHYLLDHCTSHTCSQWIAKEQCASSALSWRNMLSPDIEITELQFSPLAQDKAIEIKLSTRLLTPPQRHYHTSALVELMNQ